MFVSSPIHVMVASRVCVCVCKMVFPDLYVCYGCFPIYTYVTVVPHQFFQDFTHVSHWRSEYLFNVTGQVYKMHFMN